MAKDRHKQILDGALQSFIQHGYAGTSMRDIARRAHLSRSLLYLQFASKEDLFGALVEELLDESFERAMRVLGTRGSRRQRLLGVIDAWELQLYERIAASPHGDELFAAAWKLRPRLEATHRRRTQELFGDLIEDEARREVFLLAL